jgi:hypothetical protein
MASIGHASGLSTEDLLAMATSPAIRDALQAIADFNALRANAIASPARLTALDALAEIAASSDDPLERRRAASAFIRSTRATGGLPPSAHPRERADEGSQLREEGLQPSSSTAPINPAATALEEPAAPADRPRTAPAAPSAFVRSPILQPPSTTLLDPELRTEATASPWPDAGLSIPSRRRARAILLSSAAGLPLPCGPP